jgi:hypothetical protein
MVCYTILFYTFTRVLRDRNRYVTRPYNSIQRSCLSFWSKNQVHSRMNQHAICPNRSEHPICSCCHSTSAHRSFAPLHTVRSQPLHTVRSQPLYTVRASLFDCIGMLWHCIKLTMRLQYNSSITGRAIVLLSWTCPCSMVPMANLCCRMEIVPFNARPGCVLGAYRTTTGMLHVSWNAALH